MVRFRFRGGPISRDRIICLAPWPRNYLFPRRLWCNNARSRTHVAPVSKINLFNGGDKSRKTRHVARSNSFWNNCRDKSYFAAETLSGGRFFTTNLSFFFDDKFIRTLLSLGFVPRPRDFIFFLPFFLFFYYLRVLRATPFVARSTVNYAEIERAEPWPCLLGYLLACARLVNRGYKELRRILLEKYGLRLILHNEELVIASFSYFSIVIVLEQIGQIGEWTSIRYYQL